MTAQTGWEGCGCGFCALQASMTDVSLAGGIGNPSTVIPLSNNILIDGVLTGFAWTGTTLTYSFPTTWAEYDPFAQGYGAPIPPFNLPGNEHFAVGVITTMMMTAANFALTPQWGPAASGGFSVEAMTGLTINFSQASNATIRIALTDTDPYGYGTAWGYFPGNANWSGDVWFYRFNASDPTTPVAGNWAWATMIHELGHALGLKHTQGPFDNGANGVTFPQMPAFFDRMEYSIMSYKSYVGADLTAGGYRNETWGYAQTWMMLDILALQHMYGADFTPNTSEVIYSWRPDTGTTFVNGDAAIEPGSNRIFATIWDGGGNVTYDLSAYTGNLQIDLRPGAHSRFSDIQLANLGDGNFAQGNIYNAMQFNGDMRSLVRKAVGGAGDDMIEGNNADNELLGGGGNDTIRGNAGDDLIRGGDGHDQIFGGPGRDTLHGDAGNDTIQGEEGADLIYGGAGQDLLFGGAGLDTIHGGTGNDTIYGGANGDLLHGEAGDDLLHGDGGADTLYGGAGNDTLHGGTGHDELFGGSGDDLLYGGDNNDTIRGGPGHDTAYGGDGRDLIYGGDGDDSIWGDAGNDTIYGGDGRDFLRGGSGNDLIFGGEGNDTIAGNDGNDTLWGDDGDDLLNGGAGDDLLRGGAGDDRLYGAAGDDTLAGNAGHDALYGGAGNDVLYGGAGNDSLWGDEGNDTLDGGAGNDILRGGEGDDLLYGGAGDDTLAGNEGDDSLYGGDGDDRLIGGAGDDRLWGDEGNDTLEGGAGDDLLRGGDGDDHLYGGADNDTLAGNAGNDMLDGGSGDDSLIGGTGNDTLYGGSGNDTLHGGTGSDILYGGAGADVFVWRSAGESEHNGFRDRIGDFTPGVDRIDLSGLHAGMSFVTSYSGTAGEVRYNATIGRLFVDMTGNGASDFSIDLTGAPALTAADLIL